MGRARELGLVALVALALTILITYPLAFHPATLGRAYLDDGRFSIWNVAWVARTLAVDPRHVFDANIFYPHRSTLAYSENNVGAGLLALPVYWTTRNPHAAHNFVLLASFVLTFVAMYLLVRHLTGDRRAATISAICFAFTPFVLSHTAHIQLLMDAFLPFSALAFHRLLDRPTPRRGALLGVVMAVQAICCGYYGVFVALWIGYAVLVVASVRRWWADARYWISIAVAALVAVVVVAPVLMPYVALQRGGGIDRSLEEAVRWSADWRAYFASAAHAHAMLRRAIGHWNEVLFPGAVSAIGGVAGLMVTRSKRRELVWVYGGSALLALWASFGPRADLYTIFYRTLPVFRLLHAPARFGLLVAFSLAVLTGVALAELLAHVRRPSATALLIGVVAAAELVVTIDFRPVPAVTPAYRYLSHAPRGPLVELPFFERRAFLPRHTVYMLASTAHWMPLVNGYSDYIPDDFVRDAVAIAPFPFPAAFGVLQRYGVKYVMFHLNAYDASTRSDVEKRIDEFRRYLRLLYAHDDTKLYEIVAFP